MNQIRRPRPRLLVRVEAILCVRKGSRKNAHLASKKWTVTSTAPSVSRVYSYIRTPAKKRTQIPFRVGTCKKTFTKSAMWPNSIHWLVENYSIVQICHSFLGRNKLHFLFLKAGYFYILLKIWKTCPGKWKRSVLETFQSGTNRHRDASFLINVNSDDFLI